MPQYDARPVQRAGRAVVRKTDLDAGRPPARDLRDAVVLVDTVGDLATVYTGASAAFVGKSLVPLGGQNMLEPAGLGCPVVFGPHTDNFIKESRLLLENDAALCVGDPAELVDSLRRLLRDRPEAAAMGQRARQVVVDNQGAAARNVKLVLHVLERKEAEL